MENPKDWTCHPQAPRFGAFESSPKDEDYAVRQRHPGRAVPGPVVTPDPIPLGRIRLCPAHDFPPHHYKRKQNRKRPKYLRFVKLFFGPTAKWAENTHPERPNHAKNHKTHQFQLPKPKHDLSNNSSCFKQLCNRQSIPLSCGATPGFASTWSKPGPNLQLSPQPHRPDDCAIPQVEPFGPGEASQSG